MARQIRHLVFVGGLALAHYTKRRRIRAVQSGGLHCAYCGDRQVDKQETGQKIGGIKTNIMETPYNMTCPYCGKEVTISIANHEKYNYLFDKKDFTQKNKRIIIQHCVCPNSECRKSVISICIRYEETYQNSGDVPRKKYTEIFSRRIIPDVLSKNFPNYIPDNILNDYKEACSIVELSPKASATLSRRCLQGMIRDFWGIQKDKLFNEISELKTKVPILTWEAIDSLRKIGNIGAHMEKDVNVIVEVEPAEAATLIALIESLLTEWYVGRHETEERAKE